MHARARATLSAHNEFARDRSLGLSLSLNGADDFPFQRPSAFPREIEAKGKDRRKEKETAEGGRGNERERERERERPATKTTRDARRRGNEREGRIGPACNNVTSHISLPSLPPPPPSALLRSVARVSLPSPFFPFFLPFFLSFFLSFFSSVPLAGSRLMVHGSCRGQYVRSVQQSASIRLS